MSRYRPPCPVCGGLLHVASGPLAPPDCLLHHRETSDRHMYDVLRRTMLVEGARSFIAADECASPCAGGGHLWVPMKGMPDVDVVSCLACGTWAVRTQHRLV